MNELDLQEFECLIDVLLGLELVVVNQGDNAPSVRDVGLSPRESTEEVSWHAKLLPHLVAFVAQQRVRQVVLLLESLQNASLIRSRVLTRDFKAFPAHNLDRRFYWHCTRNRSFVSIV